MAGDNLDTDELIKTIRELGSKGQYEDQGKVFLEKTDTEFKTEFLRHGVHFAEDGAGKTIPSTTRDIYQITLTRGERVFIFNFGQSVNDSGMILLDTSGKRTRHKGFVPPDDKRKKFEAGEKRSRMALAWWMRDNHFHLGGLKFKFQHPSAYDVLAALTKYDPDTFENFCCEYGYDTDSRKAEKVYEAVKNEYRNLQILFDDSELAALREIS